MNDPAVALKALKAARAAYDRLDARRATARAALRSAVIEAVHAGLPEAEVARRAGVTRATVRAWTGK